MTYSHKHTKEDFFKWTAEHEMIIKHDDGTYRHITFKKPGTQNYRFDLITFPGHLVVSGDMGSWVFSRLSDMFVFFRSCNKDLEINPSYWGEKLESQCTTDGMKEYSQDRFKDILKEEYDNLIYDNVVDRKEEKYKGQHKALWEEIVEEVYHDGETEQNAHEAARDFEFEGFSFGDFWEHDLKVYTYRYIWICWAITWGISMYDKRDVKIQEAS